MDSGKGHTSIQLGEIFVHIEDLTHFFLCLQELYFSVAPYIDQGIALTGDKHQHFSKCLGHFIVSNSDELKGLLQFYEPAIKNYQNLVEEIEKNNEI